MVASIKKYLYTNGYLKLTKLEDKISFLKTVDISPYDINKNLLINTITSNIVDYTKELVYINNFDIMNNYINVKNITPNTSKNVVLSNWFNDNRVMIVNHEEVFYLWLIEVEKFIINYHIANRSNGVGKLNSNSIKIKPYIINIGSVVDTILSRYV